MPNVAMAVSTFGGYPSTNLLCESTHIFRTKYVKSLAV